MFFSIRHVIWSWLGGIFFYLILVWYESFILVCSALKSDLLPRWKMELTVEVLPSILYRSKYLFWLCQLWKVSEHYYMWVKEPCFLCVCNSISNFYAFADWFVGESSNRKCCGSFGCFGRGEENLAFYNRLKALCSWLPHVYFSSRVLKFMKLHICHL